MMTDQANIGTVFLFSYFIGNGEEGLHLAASRDGLTWTALNQGNSFLNSSVGGGLMRDPCICSGPDDMFHLVWTSGWDDKGIGMAHSQDLFTWSEPQWIPLMQAEPTARNCWAPEIFYDKTSEQYLIFWATTVPGRFPETDQSGDVGNLGAFNHRMYAVTTRDFTSFSAPSLFYDDGFNVIDATLTKVDSRYALVVKDETKFPVAKKNLRIAWADRAEGPYGPASEPISTDWVEGPTVLKIGDSWIVYYDEYTRHRYGAIRSSDFKQWEVITEFVKFPEGARHGSAFCAPVEIAERLPGFTDIA
jgi:beta-xylosidase